MTVLLAFAFLSGIVTILSPCILPVLPVVLGGGLGRGRARPLGVIAGFVLSFAGFTLALSALVQALHIPADALRYLAVLIITGFGLVLLLPALGSRFEALAARFASRGPSAPASGAGGRGFWGGFGLGLGIGIVWTPCVGPIMASVIGLALSRNVDGGSVLITLAYTLGTALPLFAVMLGGRGLLRRLPGLLSKGLLIQRIFGALMLAVALMIGLGLDRRFQAAVLAAFPNYGSGLTALENNGAVRQALAARRGGAPAAGGYFSAAGAVEPQGAALGDYGAAPELLAEGPWYNTEALAAAPAQGKGAEAVAGAAATGAAPGAESKGPPRASPPLSLASLRGKVVLVDFWTFSCVNCVRTLPYLRAWYQAYKDQGFVIVGVHSPEFEFEKLPSNVSAAIRDLGVSWPVAMDDDYSVWNAYGNQYWPAHYFIDAKGRVRYFHFGEGGYAESERVIRELLAEAGREPGAAVAASEKPLEAGTPETYLGYQRGSGLVSGVKPEADRVVDYRPEKVPGDGEWSLEGKWTISSEYIEPEGSGTLRLGFRARDVFLVIEPEEAGGRVELSLDGRPLSEGPELVGGLLRPEASRLYQLVKLPAAGSHLLELRVRGKLRLFAFTFG